MESNKKTYVVLLNYGTGIVHFYTFDGDLTSDDVEERLSVWHRMRDCYFMCNDKPIEVFLNNSNITPDYGKADI